MNEYEKIYADEVNFIQLREQKRISPAKRFKRGIIENALKDLPYESNVIEIGCGVGDVIGLLISNIRRGLIFLKML